MNEARRILVIAAHADDETIGAGATIAAHALAGHSVRIVVLSHSITSRPGSDAEHAQVAGARRAAVETAASVLGAESAGVHGLPDNRFDTVPFLDVVQLIESEVRAFLPTDVYTHYAGDLSRDHRVTVAAVLTAVRPVPGQNTSISSFEIRSSTDWADGCLEAPAFRPNVWHAVGPEAVARKFKALDAYQSELREWPHSRSVEALDAQLRHRGAQVGVDSAEAFVLLRATRLI